MSFIRAKQLLPASDSWRRLQQANTVHAARPGMRNVDSRWSQRWWLRPSLTIERVDKTKMSAAAHVIQFIERVVIALIVGHEDIAGLVAHQSHGKSMTRANRANVEEARIL